MISDNTRHIVCLWGLGLVIAYTIVRVLMIPEYWQKHRALLKLEPIVRRYCLQITRRANSWLALQPALNFQAKGIISEREVSFRNCALLKGGHLCARLGITPLIGAYSPQENTPFNISSPQRLLFSICHRSLFTEIGMGLGTKDGLYGITCILNQEIKEFRTDDSSFDSKWAIYTNQPEFMRGAFNDQIRYRIISSKNDLIRMVFMGFVGEVRLDIKGALHKRDNCECLARQLPVLMSLAEIAESFPKYLANL